MASSAAETQDLRVSEGAEISFDDRLYRRYRLFFMCRRISFRWGWGRVRATTTADTGQAAEDWREPTGGVGLLKASSTRVTQDPVIVWKQTYRIIQLFCTNQQGIRHLQFILFLSTDRLS